MVMGSRSRRVGGRVALSLTLVSAFACASAPDPAATVGATPVLELREGATVSGEVFPGHPHVFPLPLEEGTYFEFHLDRSRNELAADVFEPGVAADENGEDPYTSGEVSADPPGQMLWEVAKATGVHHLRVEAKGDQPVSYRLTVTALHPATERDWSRHRGLEVYAAGKKLLGEEHEEEAFDRFLEAGELFERGEYAQGVAAAHNRRGEILQSEKRWAEARTEYQAARELLRRAGDPRSEAGTLLLLAILEQETTHWDRARDYVEQSLRLARETGARLVEANGLNESCNLATSDGGYERAIEICQRSLDMQLELDRSRQAVGALINLGTVYRYRGDAESARSCLLRAQKILGEHPNRPLEATARNELATLLDLEGEYLDALTNYQEALDSYEALGETSYASTILFNMGTIHQRLGDLEATFEYYRQALDRLGKTGDHLQRGHMLEGLGWVYIHRGDLQKAESVLSEAMDIARAAGNTPLLAACLERIGELRVASGQPREAIESLERSLDLYHSSGSRWRQPSVLVQLAEAYVALGDPQRAVDLLNDAAALYDNVGRRTGVADSYYRIARVEKDRGNLEAARRAIVQAVAVAESLRPQVGSDDLRTLISATTRPYYELYVETLMAQHDLEPEGGHDAEALRESERARARSLLEILSETDLDIGQEVSEDLLARRASIRQRLNDKELQRQQLINSGDTAPGDLFRMKLDLEGLLTDLQEVERKIRAASPRYAALTRPEPVSVGEIQPLLDSETGLLEYLLGEERSFLWVVTAGSFRSYDLPAREEIEKQARCVHWLITAYGGPPDPAKLESEDGRCLGDSLPSYRTQPPGANPFRTRVQRRRTIQDAFEREARRLSQMLLGPPAHDGHLPFRLAVVSDGALEYVPFAALPSPETGGEPLVVRHELVRLPSASVLAFQRAQEAPPGHPERELAIVADPVYGPSDPRLQAIEPSMPPAEEGTSTTRAGEEALAELPRLDFSGREAQEIAAFAPSRTLLLQGFDANRESVANGALSGARYVHFATHGTIDTEHPQLSSLVLSLMDRNGRPDRDGYLRLHDIYGLDLHDADLVVLSACETALGREVRGEGLVGLTRGFLYAGAERVVASLWRVQDVATADLMQRFYRGLLEEGCTPADALRRAQLETRRSNQGSRAFPYYWAGFVLQGEWR